MVATVAANPRRGVSTAATCSGMEADAVAADEAVPYDADDVPQSVRVTENVADGSIHCGAESDVVDSDSDTVNVGVRSEWLLEMFVVGDLFFGVGDSVGSVRLKADIELSECVRTETDAEPVPLVLSLKEAICVTDGTGLRVTDSLTEMVRTETETDSVPLVLSLMDGELADLALEEAESDVLRKL